MKTFIKLGIVKIKCNLMVSDSHTNQFHHFNIKMILINTKEITLNKTQGYLK